jgi:hypothetical protein
VIHIVEIIRTGLETTSKRKEREKKKAEEEDKGKREENRKGRKKTKLRRRETQVRKVTNRNDPRRPYWNEQNILERVKVS